MKNKKLTRRKMLAVAGAAGIASFAGTNQVDSAPPKAKPQSEAYRLVVLAANPTGYWRLGETAGATSAADETLHRHDGKYLGQPKFETQGAIVGDPNGAVTLDGQSYVEIPDDPAFSQPTSGAGLTVEVWLRPDKLDFAEDDALKYIHWLGKGEAGQQEWGFRFYTKGDTERSNRISAYIWNLEGKLGAGAYFQDMIVVGEWLHIVACYEPGDASIQSRSPGVQIYKNGVFRKGPPERGTLYNNPPEWSIMPAHGKAPVRLGTRDRKGFLIGGLDEVAIYPRVLTAEEIRLHYEIGAGARKLSATELAKLKRVVNPKK
jgi:hypothetical protein